MRELATQKLGHVAVLECDFHRRVHSLPRIARDEVHLIEVQCVAILLLVVVAVAHIHHIIPHILLHHIPRTSAQPKTLALSDGVEPVTTVLAELASGLDLYYAATLLAQMAANEVVVVDFAQEADSLAVLAVGIGHLHIDGNAAHLALGQIADGENYVLKLLVADLCKEISLVLHRVNCRGEILATVDKVGGSIVSGSGEVEILSPSLLKVAELYHLVAHHIGVRSETSLHGAQSILHHILPVFLVERHHLKGQAILPRNELAHFNVLLSRAVTLAVIHTDANVEKREIMPLLHEPMHHHSAIHTARNQYRNIFLLHKSS